MAKFKPGQSGNPRGRPRGTGRADKLRQSIDKDMPEIIRALVAAAKEGDVQAARVLLDRAVPALKPVDTPVTFPVGETLSDTGQAILTAVGGGQITPETAGRLLQGLGAQARVEEIAELKERLDALQRVLMQR